MNGFWSRFIAPFVYYWTKSIWEVRGIAFTLPDLSHSPCLCSGAGREVEGGRRQVRGWDNGKQGLRRSPKRGNISLNCSVSKGSSPRGVDCESRLGGRREVEGGPPTPKPDSLPSLRSMCLASLFLVICCCSLLYLVLLKMEIPPPFPDLPPPRPFPVRFYGRQQRGIRNT